MILYTFMNHIITIFLKIGVFFREIDMYFWNMKMKNGKNVRKSFLTRFIFMVLDFLAGFLHAQFVDIRFVYQNLSFHVHTVP